MLKQDLTESTKAYLGHLLENNLEITVLANGVFVNSNRYMLNKSNLSEREREREREKTNRLITRLL